nr:MAG: internal scaffolding protein [Microviridae sp.]
MKRIATDSYLVEERVDDLYCKEKTLTQQHFAEDVDVNTIVARALKTGILGNPDSINAREAVFADVSAIGDYNVCLNRIIAAQSAFMELPVNIRTKFDNDPAKMLNFLNNPANFDACIEMGLLVKREPVKPVEPVTPAPVEKPV